MSKKEKYLAKGSDFELSLSKLMGKEVTDVLGYVDNEFGDDPEDLVFNITNIQFKDGSTADVGGEHDLPYLESYDKDFEQKMFEILEEE